MQRLTRFVLMGICVALAAAGCGGGGGSSTSNPAPGGSGTGGGTTDATPFGLNTGIGGSGGTRGAIKAFGSIFVNDLRLDIDAAEFEIEGTPYSGVDGQSRLKEGQQIIAPYDVESFDGSEYAAVEVYYRSDIKGPISAPPANVDPLSGSGTFLILGQTVITNAATRFHGIPDIGALTEGDLLEVSGTRDADGRLIATFIERKDSLAEYKVTGTVSAVTATTFGLHGLTVDYSGTNFDPQIGDAVEVKLPPSGFTAPAAARAQEIEQLPELRVEEGAEVQYEGYIDRFSSSTDFAVNGLPVTTNAGTSYENGDASALGLNVKVEVKGTVNASGILVAEEVELQSTNAVRAESTIAPEGVDLVARTVTTDVGLTFAIRTATEFEDQSSNGVEELTLTDLAPGDFVRIRGFLDGQTLIAVELERDDPDTDFRVRAPISSIDADTGTLELLGAIAVLLSDTETSFGQGDSLATFLTLVAPGTFVEASWNPWDPGLGTLAFADSVSIQEEDQ